MKSEHPDGNNDDVVELGVVDSLITANEVGAAVRHDLRGSLDTALVLTTLLRDEVKEDHKAEAHLRQLQDELGRMSASLDKLTLTYHTPDADESTVDVSDVWDEVLSSLAGRLQSLNIRTIYVGPRPMLIRVARDWFRIMLMNVVLNSIEAFAAVTSRDSEIRLETRLPRLGEDLEIIYRDNGPGIQITDLKSDPEKIFFPGVSTKVSGPGLGLTLVKRVSTQMSGSVEIIDSRHGLSIMIRLPEWRFVGPVNRAAQSPVVLIVDDDVTNAELRSELLARRGCRVIVSHSIESASAAIRESPAIDLVLTDINLGPDTRDRSGIEFAKWLRTMEPGLPIVGYSGLFGANDLSTSERASFDHVLLRGSVDSLDRSIRIAAELAETHLEEISSESIDVAPPERD